jgi:tetratricopeptide (TPR) repeat protein
MRADPPYKNPWIQLGVAYSRSGDHRACLAHRIETAARFPDDYLNHYNLGVSQRREAQRLTMSPGADAVERAAWDRAIASFERAQRMEPRDADTYAQLGFCLMEAQRELERAEAQFKKALQISPQLPAALDGMRQVQLRMRAQQADRMAAGSCVHISGLVSRPEYNGLSARVLSLDESSARYCVLLDGPDGKELQLKCKRENLKRV